jgi:hypothetical protein
MPSYALFTQFAAYSSIDCTFFFVETPFYLQSVYIYIQQISAMACGRALISARPQLFGL